MREIKTADLKERAYWESYKLQQQLVDEKIKGDATDYLLLVEHPHTYTTGRGGDAKNLPHGRIPVFRMNRGGDVTYHGPGQLVCYPIIDLKTRGRDISAFLRTLETGIIETLGSFGLDTRTVPSRTGVWSGAGKIASIGIGVRRWVTFHGLAINVDPDLSYFAAIKPCGLSGVNMTSMAGELGGDICIEDVKRRLTCTMADVLNG